jgi:hypothetical protein
MTTLADLLDDAATPVPDEDAFLASYALLRNPFPPARTIYPEVIYDQQSALEKFALGMKSILTGTLERRAMAVIGGTGGGKSHFLRHCQYHIDQLRRQLLTVEFLAGTSSAMNLVREILRGADDLAKKEGEQDFLSAVVNRIDSDEDLGPVRQSDLRSCLRTLVDASASGFVPRDMYGRYTSEVLREVARRWLTGGTLSQTERNQLRVSGRLATASLMIRIMSELFALARHKGLLQGVVLCLDEVEALFTSGVSTAKIQAFLQDVRYLFDEAVGKDSGYSLMVVSASTATGIANLRDFNYPLFQRLGFESEAREQLHQVSGVGEARAFANVYLDFERGRFLVKHKGSKVPIEQTHSLITEGELSAALFGSGPQQQSSTSSQARLLEELHKIVELKRSGKQ